jgi:hypothetical protein
LKTTAHATRKTARFSAIVDAAGRPDVHVLLTAPEDDKVLQAAIKQDRVMTIEQTRSSGKADRGTIGFEPGQSRQFLIFPKSLARFAGSTVVAIKYDLLKQGDSRVPSRAFVKTKAAKTKMPSKEKRETRAPSTAKIIPFRNSEPATVQEPVEPLQDLRKELQKAVDFLAQGRRSAATDLLKRIINGLRPPGPGPSKS